MTETNRGTQGLRDDDQFRRMPQAMQAWILASPNASDDFAAFFAKSGTFEPKTGVGLPYYSPQNPPSIVVDQAAWNAALVPGASEWPQRHMLGTLAHEIGHDRYNTDSVPFTGRTADEYVKYRAELEANAIFNAFPIFKDLEKIPEFKNNKPFGSIGYLNEIELGALYGDWKAGKLDDAAVVKQIAAKVADTPYTLRNPPQDMNRDGVITHRDAYLRDFDKYIEPKLKPKASVNEPVGLSEQDKALGDKLREPVRALDQEAGKDWDGTSERLWGAALVMAKEKGFTARDDLQLAFNKPTENYPAGELLHLYRQGPSASPDPYANRAHMATAEAISVPMEQRYQQVEAIGLAQAEQMRLAQQQELTLGQNNPSVSGPKMTLS